MENFNILVSGGQQDEDLVSDGWTDIIRSLTSIAAFRTGKAIAPEDIPATVDLLRTEGPRLHSRKLRSFDEPPFR